MVLQSLDNNVNNNQRLTIHPATAEDTRAISAVLVQGFYSFPDFANWIYPVLQFTINEDLRYRLRSQSPVYNCFVAKLSQLNPQSLSADDSELIVVGTIEVALRSLSLWSSNPQYPYISNLAVAPDFRRLGIGRQLLAKCEQTALDWGYQETRLHVLDSNIPAKQLYGENGYQISQIEANWGNLWFNYSPRLLLRKQISTC
ncbi:MAG: GNAT family N-acetyltransferase [Cyanobacteria bacterium P01_A01_bin.40]